VDRDVHPRLLTCLCNPPAPPVIYTLSLHDALPIYPGAHHNGRRDGEDRDQLPGRQAVEERHGPSTLPRRVLDGRGHPAQSDRGRSEEHTSELQSRENLVCRLLLEKKKNKRDRQEAP